MQKTKEKISVGANCVSPLAKNKGITLVALVITIIVLLILAGVAISALAGDNGLIAKAKQSAGEYDNASKEEEKKVNSMLDVMNGPSLNDRTTSPELPEVNGSGIATKNHTIKTSTEKVEITIPRGFSVAKLDNTTGDVTGKLPKEEWNNIKEEDIGNGIVIVDEEGNEFVWVPANGVNVEFSRYDFGSVNNITLDTPVKKSGTDPIYSDLNTSPDVYACTEPVEDINLQNAVTDYKGFYVGRYEAGITEDRSNAISTPTEKPQSKKGLYPYVEIAKEEAESFSRNMYTKSDKIGVESKLMSSTTWDTICMWIGVPNVTLKGNAGDETVKTGSNNEWKVKNIYDLYLNCNEWTTEVSDWYGYIIRGGSAYDNNGMKMGERIFSSDYRYWNTSFRPILSF